MILRPFTPPRAFTYLKYAFAPSATERKPCATPVSGAVPPMWIDVGVIPGSEVVPPKATGIPSDEERSCRDEEEPGHWS